MLRNYLAAAIRNLFRARAYAAINIIGLGIGFAAAILIGLFVRDEYSYDRFFPDHERLFKVDQTVALPGRAVFDGNQTFSDIAQALKLEFSQVDMTARLVRATILLRRGEIEGSVPSACWVDADFFHLFPFKALAGDPATALTHPDGIVITRRIARRYWGRDDVLGETIVLNREQVMRVSAVIEDLPANTHLVGDVFLPAIASFSALTELDAVHWGTGKIKSFMVYTYVRLRQGTQVADINAAMAAFVKRHVPGEFNGAPMATIVTMRLSPVADTHLQSRLIDAMKPQGDKRTLHGMMTVACLILLVAGSNFVSMMTARAARRAVEVGVRKVCGATKRQIAVQFLGECMFYAMLALLLALVAVDLLMPAFNGFLQRQIAFDYFRDPLLGGGILGLATVTGLAAGAYPTLVLSRYRPGAVLKGIVLLPGGSGRARQVLVICQLAAAVALTIGTITIDRQMRYALRERLDFPTEQIYMSTNGCSPAFSDAASRLRGVLAATCASSMALAQSHWGAGFSSPTGDPVSVETAMVDYRFFDLFGIKPIAGRLLAADHGEDDVLHAGNSVPANPSIVINESAARVLGYSAPQGAVGQSRSWTRPELEDGAAKTSESMTSQIVGVIPDFSIGSVRDLIEPTAYYIDPALSGYALLVKLDGHMIPQTLEEMRKLSDRLGAQRPFEGAFLSQYLNDLYSDIVRQATLFSAFSSVAVLTAALGLLGLAVFTAERRTREIGLRKVMGASRGDILRFLGWHFARPVLWANVIAWPIGYFAMRRWLEGFAYHANLDVFIFIAASVLSIAVTFATVLGHALLVARAKPAGALRYE